MSLRNSTVTNEQKLQIVEGLIVREELDARRYGKRQHTDRAMALKCIAGEIRARLETKRDQAQADIEERLAATLTSRSGPNYAQGQLAQLAITVIQHWPLLRQALESFKQGENS